MYFVDLRGDWLRKALIKRKPKRESTSRFVDRCMKMLQRDTGIDRTTLDDIVASGTAASVPLFVVALIARWLGCSVDSLVSTADAGKSDDAFEDTSRLEAEAIKSANAFVDFIKAREILFPLRLWHYAFPIHRRGDVGVVTFGDWEALYEEMVQGE